MEQQNNNTTISYIYINRHYSASILKTLAIVFMLIDHAGLFLLSGKTASNPGIYSIFEILRSLGRLSFPLYSFLLIQGFKHSHNRFSYFLWLLGSAIITEPFFNLAHVGKWEYPQYQNTLFTLSLGLLMLIIIEEINNLNLSRLSTLLLTLLVLITVISIGYFIHSDYGVPGPVMILGLKLIDDKSPQNPMQMYGAMIVTIYISYLIKNSIFAPWNLTSISGLTELLRSSAGIQLYGAFSIFFISRYNGMKGRQLPKLFYYAIYPVHLMIFGLIKLFTP